MLTTSGHNPNIQIMENKAFDILKDNLLNKNTPLLDCPPAYSSPKFCWNIHPNFQRPFYLWPLPDWPKISWPRMGPPPPKGYHGLRYFAYIPYQPKTIRLCHHLWHILLQLFPFCATWYQSNCSWKYEQPSVLVSPRHGCLVYHTIDRTLSMYKILYTGNLKCPQLRYTYLFSYRYLIYTNGDIRLPVAIIRRHPRHPKQA